MNILMTGGTGLIGSHLTARLTADGHHVSVLTRNPEIAGQKLPSGGITQLWDGRTTQGWAHLIEESDAVINLAGESIAGESLLAILTRRWTAVQKTRILQSRTDTGQTLVAAIASATQKPKVLIQASAVGFYGPHREESIPEHTPAGRDFLAEVCRSWEASTAKVEEMGARRVIIRTGLVLAPKGGILPMMLLPFHLFAGGPIGGGKQFIPWIHIRDEINAIRFLLENETAQGAYNLSAPNPVSNAEFGRITGKVLHRPSWLPTPGLALKLALGEKASLVLEGQRAVPQRLLEAGYPFEFENLEAALRDLV